MSNWWCGWVAYLWEDSSLSSWLSGSRERGGSMSDREAVLRDELRCVKEAVSYLREHGLHAESVRLNLALRRITDELTRLWAIEDAAREVVDNPQLDVGHVNRWHRLRAALGKDT